jgi:hypothetical protein
MLITLLVLTVAGADVSADLTPGPVTLPVWQALPTGQDMARYRPARAKVAGRAVIECKVAVRGVLEYCKVVEETPGEDYGKAALRVSAKFRIGPVDKAGQPTAGRSIRLPMTWALPPSMDD